MRFLRYLPLFFVVLSPLRGQHQFVPHVDKASPPIFLQESTDDSIISVIVEFEEEPLFVARQRSLSVASADVYRSRFAQFALDAGQSVPKTFAIPRQKEFFRVFFGVKTALPRRALATIRRLPYVKDVQPERRVAATLEESSSQIHIPESRTTRGVDGTGVLVGIIDTGVDYLHPALGGGIGVAFKVIGGYDFVNDDPDPMDDNGHGTHVAGIIAADGSGLQGVAPGARLLVYKALDASGRGLEGDILAAIERMADPNQDGDPSDHPDVVNMSLGARFGTPDDPLSTAVDNAVRLGITFCVAAGNSGGYTPVEGKEDNYYYTGMESVESPGTARFAITVGAVDSLDTFPRFSSKGPARGTMEIKPDVLAPGVDILSLAPGGGTATKSGTSMSCPMVAGLAALLKSAHKTMTPEEVKSAIVHSASNLGLTSMRQGGGRIDEFRALKQQSFAVPSEISFRLDDPAQLTWTKVETLMVINKNSTPQDYFVTVAGNGVGYSVTASPHVFSLLPGGTQTVLVSIQVNNIAVPIVDQDILLCDGALLIRGNLDTLRVPWAFARASRFLLTFSNPDPIFIGYTLGYSITRTSGLLDSKVHWIDAQTLEAIGAFTGVYNFVVYFPDAGKIVTREQVSFQESGSIAFNAQDAIHTLRFGGRDENGLPFPSTADTRRTLRVDLPFDVPLFVALPTGSNSIMISPSSNGIHYHPVESYIDLAGTRRAVLPQYDSFLGITGDRLLLPAAGAYTKQTLRFKIPSGIPRAKIYSEIISIQRIAGTDYYNAIQVDVDTLDVGTGEVSIAFAEMRRVDTSFTSAIAFYVNAGDLSQDFIDYSTRYLTVPGDSLLVGLPSQQSLTSYKSPDGGVLAFGGAPVHIVDVSSNGALQNSIIFRPIFRGNLFEERYTDADHGTYAIYNAFGDKLTEGPLNAPRSPFSVTPGKYRIDIQSEHFTVSNAKGKVTLSTFVDLAKTVPDASTITSFMICDGHGRAGDRVSANDSARLRFSANSFAFEPQLPVRDSTHVFYRDHRSTQWISVPVSYIGSEPDGMGSVFQADLAAATAHDSAGIDLRIRLVDPSGNVADMVVSPAFQVGFWIDQGTSDVPQSGEAPVSFALMQNYPNPFNGETKIGVRVSGLGSRVRLVVYDLLGREVKVLLDERKEPGSYEVTWDAGGCASGVYICRMIAGRYVASRKMVLTK
jgi:hypothetical protein